jgi:predicted GIY-YIG superfamily endonuclease
MITNAREGYIYRIIAPGSNSVYVGQSYDPHKRFKQHKRFRGDNPKLANWLRKHPDAEIYFWPVIDMDAEEIADEAECRRLGYDLLNLIPCGSTPPLSKGRKYTADVIARKTAARWTPEACERQSAVMMGRKHTPETIAKISATSPRRKHTPEEKARQSVVMTGRKHTPGHNAKIAAAGVGRKQSVETRTKRSASITAWHATRRSAQKERG